MLEQNRRTWLAAQNKMIDDLSINTLLDQILEDVGCIESRASKMDVDDLLKLLAAFHEVGIHFS